MLYLNTVHRDERPSVLKNVFLPFALLLLCQTAHAQQPTGAGSQLQQIPSVPTPQEIIPIIGIEWVPAPAPPESDAVKILVNRLQVTGASVYSEAELLELTGFSPGSELNLAELRFMAQQITNHYRSHGYVVAQAYLPTQESHDATVTMAVIEGQYGKIEVRNKSALSDSHIQRLLEGLNSGDTILFTPIVSRLLLLSDVPDVRVTSTLTPGASLGMSDLIVYVFPGARATGSIDADNSDNSDNLYTGEYGVGVTVNLNNTAGLGDVAPLREAVALPSVVTPYIPPTYSYQRYVLTVSPTAPMPYTTLVVGGPILDDLPVVVPVVMPLAMPRSQP